MNDLIITGIIPEELLQIWKIRLVSAGRDRKGSQTEDRKYFTTYAALQEAEGILGSERIRSRNFHETGEVLRLDGSKQLIKAQAFFNSVMDFIAGGNDHSKVKWEFTPPGQQSSTFVDILGQKFYGRAVTHWHEPSEIATSIAKNKNIYQSTLLILKGENTEQVFAQNDLFIVTPETLYGRERIKYLKNEMLKANAENMLARNERRLNNPGNKAKLLSPEVIKSLSSIVEGKFDQFGLISPAVSAELQKPHEQLALKDD